MSARPELNLSLDLIKDNVPARVAPNIFLGSLHAALNQDALQERGITHVCNLSGLPATFPKHFCYLTIEVNDNKASDILTCIPATNIFIESALESGGSILVHCYGGRSRSPAVIIAYLMSTQAYTYDRALAQLQEARSVVALNTGFEMQLRAYGAAGCDVYNAHQLMLQSRLLTISRAKRRRSAVVFNEPPDEALRKMSEQTAVSIPKLCMPIRQVAMLRLSRPGAKAVQVIPPLQGLELDFKCKACSTTLFQASSILRHLPGKSPIVSRDLSWMVAQEPRITPPPDDDAEGFGPPGTSAMDVLAANGLVTRAASTGESEGDANDVFGTAGCGFAGFGTSRGMPLTTPRAGQAKLAQKSKSFAVRSSSSAFSSGGFDSFGVPPTPSNRRGRGDLPSKQPKIAFASPIHEATMEEDGSREGGDSSDDDEDVNAGDVEVVDEGDSFDRAIGLSAPSFGAPSLGGSSAFGGGDAPTLAFGGPPSLSFGAAPAPTLSFGAPAPTLSFGAPALSFDAPAPAPTLSFGGPALSTDPFAGAPAPALTFGAPALSAPSSFLATPVETSSVSTPVDVSTAPAPLQFPAASPQFSDSGSVHLAEAYTTKSAASSVAEVPLSARGVSAEKTRFLEKMKWLEEVGLEPGARRTDEEVAQVSGGTGSAALTRRGLRKIRSSTAMQVADADAAAATLHCECVFVEPLGWMGELHGKSGVLKCPECAKQLGFFDWTGASCSCKASVQPGFCIQTSAVFREQPAVRGKPARE